MATYTVIQDIEAEDKFLGPLTLKQFIFGAAGIFFGYLGFFAVSQGAAFLVIFFLPPMLLGFFLAIPWSKEQPTELWVLAKLRFRLKPQVRFWDQSGLEELVTVTVPKKIERQLTDGLDQSEVQSRLQALADTIDSRGWVTKHATLNQGLAYGANANDRLLSPSSVAPMEVPEIDINSYTDVLDEDTSVSSNFEHMIEESSQQRRQQSLDKMERVRRGEPLSAVQQPAVHFTPPAAPAQFDEELLSQQLKSRHSADLSANQRMHTIPTQPVFEAPMMPEPTVAAEPQPEQAQAPMTPAVDPDIMRLAGSNDLNIETIARQANKTNHLDDSEVVVSLR